MCILLLTTAHPEYSLVLLSNRDEHLSRTTARAQWWSAAEDTPEVLSGRDQVHPAHGTWLGLTRAGRLAALTNFREKEQDSQEPHPVDYGNGKDKTVRSRGEITKEFLLADADTSTWAERFVGQKAEGGEWANVGGFSLFIGTLAKSGVELAVLSNRTQETENVIWLKSEQNKNAHGFACALSNSHFGDHAWPKVVEGEALLGKLVEEGHSGDALLDHCFEILSTDSMPARQEGESIAAYTTHLRETIFIPRFETDLPAGPYGTQKQTVLLVSRDGKVIFVERTLYDNELRPVPLEQRDLRFEFNIDGW